MVKGTEDVIKDPFLRAIAAEVEKSKWIQIAMDQLLGPDTVAYLTTLARTLPQAICLPNKPRRPLNSRGNKTRCS